VVTATNNFEVWCGKNGRGDVLADWANPDKAPDEITPGSSERVPWKCGTCGHGQGLTLAHFRAQLEDLRYTSLTLELNLGTYGTHKNST
jgi:hypothetical protein